MANHSPLGFGLRPPNQAGGPSASHVVARHPLRRVLAFTGRTIDDVVNDPIAKNEVRGYYKLSRMIQRRGEVTDLEKQWNPLGIRTA